MDQLKRLLLGQLNLQLKNLQAKCIGFVIMPDHVHAIVWFAQIGQLSQFMQVWKRDSSRSIGVWYQSQQVEYLKNTSMEDRLWTPKYYAFQIYSTEKLVEKLEYMHQNPVRAELVERATDRKWSSVRWYDSRRSVGVPISWID